MMDSLQQLQSTVETGKVDATNYALSTQALGSADIDALSAKYLQNQQIALQNYQITTDDSGITVSGTGANLPFTGMGVNARFTLQGTAAEVYIQATGAADWNLASSFPIFKDAVLAQLQFAPSPTLQFASYNVSTDVQAGMLFFRGTLALTSILSDLAYLFGMQGPVLAGPIDIQNGVPNMALTANIPAPIDVGLSSQLSLTFQACSIAFVDVDANLPDARAFLRFQCALPFKAQGTDYSIPIIATIYNAATDIKLTVDLANLSQAISAAVTELAGLAQNVTFADKVPSLHGLQLANLITLQNVFADINPSAASKLVSFGVMIGNSTPWTLIEDASIGKAVTVSNFQMLIDVPLATGTPNVTITGMIGLGAQGLFVLSVFGPDYAVTGALAPGLTVNLTEVIEYFVGSDTTGIPTLAVAGFDFYAQPGTTYSLDVDLQTDWTFTLDAVSLTIEDVKVAFQYDQQTGSTASITGDLSVAGADLNLVAAYAGPTAGWLFKETAAVATPINLIDVVNQLLPKNVQVPTDMVALQVKNLISSWNAQSQQFTFGGEADFTLTLGAQKLAITFTLAVDSTVNSTTSVRSTTGALTGTLQLGRSTFAVTYQFKSDAQILSASWSEQGGTPVFADIAQALGFPVPNIPSSWGLELDSAAFTYDFTAKIFIMSAQAQLYAQSTDTLAATLIIDDSGATTLYGFALDLNIDDINLSNLPLVGKALASVETLGVDNLQIVIAGASGQAQDAQAQVFAPTEVAKLNPLIQSGYPQLPAAGVSSGVNFSGSLSSGSTTTNLTAPMSGASAGAAAGAASGDPDNTKWYPLQKSFGPVSIKRVGVRYADDVLAFLLDASLSAAGLTIGLDGLSIGSPLTKFDPQFHLDGLGVDYAEGPLEIGGGFLAVTGKALGGAVFQYDGDVVVKAENFSLEGLGSYAKLQNGDASFFAFVQLSAELGGPPFFFVTGLAGGFGYNRTLTIPAQNEVMNFPLVQGLAQPSVLGGNQPDPMTVLGILEGQNGGKAWIMPQPGQDWLAAGVQFTSFDIIQSNALLIVEFGKTFEIAVVGLSVVRLPQAGPETYAYAELQLEIIFEPSAGLFSATAVLTSNSYVIDPSCHLTGGFAFFVWYAGDHAGDFVLTLGGYHPQFTIPAWYPQEPRLGFNWSVTPEVTIKGGAYFALTPSNVMAGGGLEVTYHSGSLQAWFTAYADMIISWKPYFFDVAIDVTVGVSYRANVLGLKKTLKVEMDVDVELWGPPTAGTAYINWYIISFTISFPSGASKNPPSQILAWDDFKTLLPSPPSQSNTAQARPRAAAPDPAICQVTVNGGLVKSIDRNDGTSLWIVRADGFTFSTATMIPAAQAALTTPTGSVNVPSGQSVNIRPMAVSAIQSTHTLTLTNSDANVVEDLSGWNYMPDSRSVPESLWGQPVAAGQTLPPQANVLPSHLMGLQGVGLKPPSPNATPPLDIANTFSYLMLDADNPDVLPLSPSAQPPSAGQPTRSDQSLTTIQNTIMQSGIVSLRSEIFGVLQGLGFDAGTDGTLTTMSQQPAAEFEASPMLAAAA